MLLETVLHKRIIHTGLLTCKKTDYFMFCIHRFMLLVLCYCLFSLQLSYIIYILLTVYDMLYNTLQPRYNAHDGSQAKRRYNEIGLPLVGYCANCTGRSCDIQNNYNIFQTACCIWPITSVIQHPHYATVGLAEPLNYGLSMSPGRLRRENGDAEAFCGSCQSCISSQRVGGVRADC